MAKIAKGTKKFYQRTYAGKKNEIHRKNKQCTIGRHEGVKELKKITLEFKNSQKKDEYSESLGKALKQTGLKKYFTVNSIESNKIKICTKENHCYKSDNYFDLAIKFLDILAEHESSHEICLYANKRKMYLYICVGIEENELKEFSKFAESLGGEKILYTVYKDNPYYEEYEDDDYDDYYTDYDYDYQYYNDEDW